MTLQNTFPKNYNFLTPITREEILYRNDIFDGFCLSQAALLGSEQKLTPATLFWPGGNHLRKGPWGRATANNCNQGNHTGRVTFFLSYWSKIFSYDYSSCRTSYNKNAPGTSPVVQWLRLHATNAEGTGLIPGPATKVPFAAKRLKKKKLQASYQCPLLTDA